MEIREKCCIFVYRKKSFSHIFFSFFTTHFQVTLRLLTSYCTSTTELLYTVSPVSVHWQANMSRCFPLVVLMFFLNDLLFSVKHAVDWNKHAVNYYCHCRSSRQWQMFLFWTLREDKVDIREVKCSLYLPYAEPTKC